LGQLEFKIISATVSDYDDCVISRGARLYLTKAQATREISRGATRCHARSQPSVPI